MPQIDIQRLMAGGYEKAKDPAENGLGGAFHAIIARKNAVEVVPEEENWLPHGPLRQINFRKVVSKRTLMEELNKTILFNSNIDLPDFVYRPDLLDPQFFSVLAGEPTAEAAFAAQSMLDASIVQLDYNEGYPTLNNSPFWKRLPFETEDAHRAFGMYLMQPGARSIGDIVAFPAEQLRDWFHEYVWLHRARAFDMFKVVDHQKRRIARMMDLEDVHFGLADRLLAQANLHMTSADFVNWDELKDPIKLARFIDIMTKVQRTAVGMGMGGTGGKDGNDIPQVPSVEVIMRKVSPKGEESSGEVDSFDLLKEDPDAVDMAQELIISVNKRS